MGKPEESCVSKDYVASKRGGKLHFLLCPTNLLIDEAVLCCLRWTSETFLVRSMSSDQERHRWIIAPPSHGSRRSFHRSKKTYFLFHMYLAIAERLCQFGIPIQVSRRAGCQTPPYHCMYFSIVDLLTVDSSRNSPRSRKLPFQFISQVSLHYLTR